MENAPTTTRTPSPLPLLIFPAPPLSAAEIAVLNAPPPPFPGPSGSVDLSPLEFLLCVVALITVPALIYTFFFAFGCPSRRRRSEQSSSEPSVELGDRNPSTVVAVTDLRYRKDAHVKEFGGECPVCLSEFADAEKLRQLSACKHSFHAYCIDMWLSDHSNCPICRADVGGAGGKGASSSAPARDHDLQQGLPDASGLV